MLHPDFKEFIELLNENDLNRPQDKADVAALLDS